MSAPTFAPLQTGADRFRQHGLKVFAADGKKQPIIPSWTQYRDREQTAHDVNAMDWQQAKGIGGFGKVCIDIDGATDRRALDTALAALGLPHDYEWAVKTPGKLRQDAKRLPGYHIWVDCRDLDIGKMRDDRPARFGADHVELRTKDVYAMLPGSEHPDGGYYDFLLGEFPGGPPAIVGSDLVTAAYDAITVAPAPKTQAKQTAHSVDGSGAGAGNNPWYAEAALSDELDTLTKTPEGRRNNQLNKIAYKLGGYVGAGDLDRAAVADKLLTVAIAIGLPESDASKTIESGLDDGIKKPRPVPAPKRKAAPGNVEDMIDTKPSSTAHSSNGEAARSNIPLSYTGPAIWRNRDHDEPVIITGSLPPIDGIAYFTTDGSNGGLPGDELLLPGQDAPATMADDDDGEPEEPHPLDIEPKRGLRLGWVDEYADLMTRMTGAPREFNVIAGLTLAATAIQRRARLRMSFGDIYPNVYAAVIAPSSVYHKSSALAKPRALLQRAMLDKLLLSELFTSEGLLKQLQGQSAGLALRDEIGTLFASHNTKYLANLKPDLTALYDCYPYSRRLSNEEVKVQAPYLNILGATTPARFFEGISYTDWQDGFLARWLFVMPEQEPDFDAMTGLYTTEHDAQLGALATTLVNIDRQQETDFALSSEAFDLWDKWQRKAAKDAYYYGDDVTAAIVTRYAAYALKFSMILAAVNGSWGTIEPTIMQTAIDLADSFKATVHKLLMEKANYGVSGAKLQKIFRVIKLKAGDDGLTQREIGQLCNLKRAELAACMDKLVSIGAVIVHSPTGKARADRYVAGVENLPAKSW